MRRVMAALCQQLYVGSLAKLCSAGTAASVVMYRAPTTLRTAPSYAVPRRLLTTLPRYTIEVDKVG